MAASANRIHQAISRRIGRFIEMIGTPGSLRWPVHAVLVLTLLASVPHRADAGPRTLFESLLGAEQNADAEVDQNEQPHLDPDRPHLPEASNTVGKGRLLLESGYTFSRKGPSFRSHSYPEAVLRIGAFADWFEFRVGQNFVTNDGTTSDTYIGMKVAVVEQYRLLPQIAIIPQMSIATENHSAVGGRVLPGVNVDASWEVLKNRFSIEFLIATNRVRDDIRGAHFETVTGLTAAVNARPDLEAFVEWDAFYPVESAVAMRHIAVGGLVYFINKDLCVDIRAGVGLNRAATDFLAGTGFSVRY